MSSRPIEAGREGIASQGAATAGAKQGRAPARSFSGEVASVADGRAVLRGDRGAEIEIAGDVSGLRPGQRVVWRVPRRRPSLPRALSPGRLLVVWAAVIAVVLALYVLLRAPRP